MSNPFGEAFSWTYLDNGWLWQQQSGSASTAIYTYNALGQVTELAHRKTSNNALLADFAGLSHDAVGNRLSLTASLPSSPTAHSGSTSYSYDNKNQLTAETSTKAGGYSNAFSYDLVGNPTTFKGTAQTFNSVNQNTFGGSVTFDANGNPQSWSGATLTYDANDRIVSIGTVLSAGYGSDGLRAWKQNSSGRTYFLYDGLVPVCEVDASGNVTAVNTEGANGMVARHVNGVGGGSVFYAFDPQGSVSLRLDTNGNVLSSHVNEAWGTQVSNGTGYANDPYAGYGGQWGYYRDVETGLHLLGHRYYDAAQGRFINRDPIGYAGGINLYAYTENNPLTRQDSSGLRYPTHSDPGWGDIIGPDDPVKPTFPPGYHPPANNSDANVPCLLFVIGENHGHVQRFASKIGGAIWWTGPSDPGDIDKGLQENADMIRAAMEDGYCFLDIGIDPNRAQRSRFYEIEKRTLIGYPWVVPIPGQHYD